MRVLVCNTYELKGGAARATWRVFKGLERAGVDVQFLVQNKASKDPKVLVTSGIYHGKYINELRPYIDFAIPFPQTRKRILFTTNLLPDNVVEQINTIDPDIVHLNWIAGGFIRIESLLKIKQPIVWTFHDMWPATGGCHSPLECVRYQSRCGACPILHSRREHDLSHSTFLRKQEVYRFLNNLSIITPSRWLAESVKSSTLLGNRRISVVPNGLDVSVFRPYDKMESRDHFGLSREKKLVVFGAIRGAKNTIKGFGKLLEAIHLINRQDVELAVFGSSDTSIFRDLPFQGKALGFLKNESEIARLYSAADVVAVPSFQEVFPQTASEATSCGAPVVAFGATGLPDIVDHKKTGYLAKPYASEDLAAGIRWILKDSGRWNELSANARKRAVKRFDIAVVVNKLMEIYYDSLD
jgi:glycosyltransferase involved in cell wall biosynthesis